MSGEHSPGAPSRESASAWGLIGTLAVAGSLAGLLIVLVHGWAEPRIQAHRAAVLHEAIGEVLKSPARYDTLYVVGPALQERRPADGEGTALEAVYRGYDESGRPIGFAITGAEPGFQDVIRLIFGYDPATRTVLGMRVLESRETPGLGDKIEKDSTFVAGFIGAEAPLRGTKAGSDQGDDHDVDMVTGATISSRTVVSAINHRIDRLQPLLENYLRERDR